MKSLSDRLIALFPELNPLLEQGYGFRVNDWVAQPVCEAADGQEFAFPEQRLALRQQVAAGDAACTISLDLTNSGNPASSPVQVLEPLSLTFRFPLDRWQLRYAPGGTPDHFYPPAAYTVTEISRLQGPPRSQPFRIESHPGGRSSELHLPVLLALFDQTEESAGLFCALEWSGEWYIQVSAAGAGLSTLSAGVKVGGLSLDERETIRLPAAHLGFFRGGFEQGTNALRRYLGGRVCPKAGQLPPVSYNHWFGIGANLSEEILKRQADRAAEIGVEYFTVDSSWFAGGFPAGVGNWSTVDRYRFPQGLQPLSRHVRDLGMKFGLWFEPERAMAGTDAVREHPELFVEVHEGSHSGFWTKDYFLLNLALPEARRYVTGMISDYVRELNLSWIRWDYNGHFPVKVWQGADDTGRTQILHYQGLYQVWDDLMTAFPGLLIEQCAGGGRRIDLGTIRRAHTIWVSDETDDPLCCRYTQASANNFLPGHLLNICVPVQMGAGDIGIDDTALLSRMLGAFQLDGDIASWSPGLARRVGQWIAEYKKIRHLVSQRYFPLAPNPSSMRDWLAAQFVSWEGREAIVFAFRGNGGQAARSLSLRGMAAGRGSLLCRRLPDGKWFGLNPDPDGFANIEARLDPLEGAAWHVEAR